jgi:hypothetical protein
MQTLGDAMKASSMTSWSLGGKTRLVKVMGPAAQAHAMQTRTVSGYVTQEKYLYGMTAQQIETALGLRPFELRAMGHVFALGELPKAADVEFHLSAALPGGRVFGDDSDEGQAMLAEALAARKDYAEGRNHYHRSRTPVVQCYPPGSAMIPQWKLTAPVPIGPLIAVVTAVFPFPRANGSIEPHRPHNRAAVATGPARPRFGT